MGVLFITGIIPFMIYEIRRQNNSLSRLISILKTALNEKNLEEMKYLFQTDGPLGEFFDRLEKYGSAVFDKEKQKIIDDTMDEAIDELYKNNPKKLEKVHEELFDKGDETLQFIGKRLLNIFLGRNENDDLKEVTNQIKYLIGFVKIEQAKMKQKRKKS